MNTRRIGAVLGWLIATVAAMVLASQAVGLVRDQVTDRPSRVPASLAATTSQPHMTTTSRPTMPPAGTAPTSTTTTAVATTTSSTAPPAASTTVPVATTVQSPNDTQTVYLIGGTVTARCTGDDVSWVSYVPNPGFEAEVENPGPGQLEIEFEGNSHKSKLRAECDSGNLDIRSDEQPEN